VEILRPGADPDAFLDSLARAPARVLMLDYDGVLAPFRRDRDRAEPYPGVRERVRALLDRGHTRLLVVTGRAVEVVVRLLGVDPPPEIWGAHGWEHLRPDGRVEPPQLTPDARGALREGRERALALTPEDRVETKPASVAVHARGLGEPAAGRLLLRVREAWAPLAAEAGLGIHAFDGGLELQVPGRDKGTAVRSVLAESPPGAAIAFLGDDLTDEDAFRALAGRGLSVLVRTRPRPTAADVRIEPPGELLGFLDAWDAGAARGGGTGLAAWSRQARPAPAPGSRRRAGDASRRTKEVE
jgi:trehalose-phosphatase